MQTIDLCNWVKINCFLWMVVFAGTLTCFNRIRKTYMGTFEEFLWSLKTVINNMYTLCQNLTFAFSLIVASKDFLGFSICDIGLALRQGYAH